MIGPVQNEAVRADSPFRTGPLRDQHDVERLTPEYVHWYNKRLHSGLDDYHTPEEYEQIYYTQSGTPTGAAASKKAA